MFLGNRIAELQASINQAREAANDDTKSSAGDKHETGRAMAQLEQEKLGKQLQELYTQAELLKRIPEVNTAIVAVGSVVSCSTMNYYMAIAIGKLNLSNEAYFAISAQSPIGQLLLGKKAGDSIVFNGNRQEILSVA